MKKSSKHIVVILVVLMLFSMVQVFDFVHVKADEMPSVKTLFEATNTYNLNGDVTKETKTGYTNPQYGFKFKMTEKNSNQTTAFPYVTVFTHGYKADSSDWCNNAEALDKGEGSRFDFLYTTSSMVYKVATNVFIGDAVVIRATVQNESNDKPYFELFLEKVELGQPKKNFDEVKIKDLRDVVGNKHLIVIFNGHNAGGSNANIYYQFNYMLSSILYKLKGNYGGKIPKVNLIGHSRGGLTNLQYALDHPDIVENLISIGTPYFGSSSATIVKNLGIMKGDGLKDITDEAVYESYQRTWNNGYESKYSKINAVAIGAYSTLPFLGLVAHSDKSGSINFWSALGIDAAVTAISVWKTASWFIDFWGAIATKAATKAVTNLLYNLYRNNTIINIAQILNYEITSVFPYVMWFSDTLVPLNSQLGLTSEESYKGFTRKDKCFSLIGMLAGNCNMNRIAQWAVPVVHNLEPWDEEIIGMVESELRKTKVEPSNFEFYEKANNEVCITGVTNQGDDSVLAIPTAITIGREVKMVTEIAAGAFGNNMIGINSQNNSVSTYSSVSSGVEGVRTVIIPDGVRKIGNGAFKGMSNLETVTFRNTKETIEFGTDVFAYCSNLQSITLPGSPTEIPAGMFKDCVSLANMPSPSSLRKIGAAAFSGCSNMYFATLPNDITEIGEMAFFGTKGGSLLLLPSAIEKIGDGAFANVTDTIRFILNNANKNYMVEDGVLYNKSGTEIVQYPKGSTDATFTANVSNSSGNTNTVTSIRPYAFYGCENLTSVNISGVEKVGEYAFANACNLETITAYSLKDVSYEAFSGTKWLEDKLNNSSQVVLSNCLLLYNSEDKKVLESGEWDETIYYIAEQAFASTELETIYIPSSIKEINDNAFYNATSLKNVYFESMNSKLVASLSSSDKKIFGNNSNDLKVFLLQNDLSQFSDSEENALAGIRKELFTRSFTLELYNGTNEVSQVTIRYSDTYSFGQEGYTINGTSYDYTNNSIMNVCFYDGIQSDLVVSGVTVATFSGWKTEDGEAFTEGTWKGIGLTAVTRLYAYWTPTEFIATLIDELNNTNETETFTYFTSANLPSPWKKDYKFRAWVDSEGNEYKLTYSGVGDIVLNAVYDQIYMIGLTSKFNYQYNKRFYGIAGTVITLPSFSVGNYYVVSWSGYPVLSDYTITKTEVLVAYWNEYILEGVDPELETMGNDSEMEYEAYKNMSGDYSRVADIGIDFDTEIDVGSLSYMVNSGLADCCFVGRKEWVFIDPRSVMINQEQFKNMRL